MSTPRMQDELPGLAEIIPHHDVKFGLPAAPATVGRELTLHNAPVVAYLVHGKPIHGFLNNFDPSKCELIIHQRNDGYLTFMFEELRFLVFSRSLIPATELSDTEKLKTDETKSSAGKPFELVFKDDKKFHASAEAILIDPVGLHIFLDKPDNYICRVFSPRQTLKKYTFDTSISRGLIEHRAVNTAHKEAPEKETPEKTKQDSSSEPEPGSFIILSPATCSKELIERLEHKWPLPSQRLGELLLAQHIINKKQLYEILLFQQHHPEDRIGELLIQKGLATTDEVYSTLAFKLGLQFVKLDAFDIDSQALTFFPRDLAIRFHVMPLLIYNKLLVVAMSDPTNSDTCKMVEFVTQHRIEVVMANTEEIDNAIDKYYRRQEDDEAIEEFEEFDNSDTNNDELIREAERQSKEKPVVRLVQNMIVEGVHKRASDIHIRPGEKSVDIILRIDGTLIPVRNFTKPMLAAVVSRIKIIGRMDISERRIAQDGRASVNLHGNKVDLRISIMPTINGESVVIRILDTMAGLRSIDDLGFNKRDHPMIKDMISHSYGILLVTGPTGSGKSTTLYAALEHIRKTNVNIITAEDPVEYHIDGIEQMQVNHQINYSFAKILRNMLRHDPDVIMVGEIRDQETAKIAIESALTGHLVLSTLHTNSAAVTVTRLLEMGVEPYLINDTLLGVLAQRLVRANCPDCIDVEEAAPSIYQALGVDTHDKFYRGKGCDNCNHTGYKGRLAVYELLQMNQETRSLVLNGVSADMIHAQAVSSGMTALTQNALVSAREKKTSLAEVYRIRLE